MFVKCHEEGEELCIHTYIAASYDRYGGVMHTSTSTQRKKAAVYNKSRDASEG